MNSINSLLSIVVPVFNEEKVLREFYKRTAATLVNCRFEILFVNDGSQDASWQIVEELAKTDSKVIGISLTRNFGHQAALTAGLEHANGDAIVTIDCDLQDPPELILSMVQTWQEGYDVVYGTRSERKGESVFKKATAYTFYKLFRKASKIEIPIEAGDFRLLSRNVVDVLNRIPERIRFLRALTSWAGFKQIGISYSRDARFAGETKYSLVKMVKLAFDGLTSFSSLPLQMASYLGLTVTAIAFLVGLYSLYIRIFTQTAVKGWTSLLTVMIFLGGVQLLMIGVIGEYIGRIYEEVKHRPIYLIQKTIGSKFGK
jgi:dolichol-phosphate mannosyltransferase